MDAMNSINTPTAATSAGYGGSAVQPPAGTAAAASVAVPVNQGSTPVGGSQKPVADTGNVDAGTLQRAVDKVSHVVKLYNDELQFSVDHDTGRTVVKMIDTQTNEVIRQIPSKEMLEIAKDLDKLAGIFVKNTA